MVGRSSGRTRGGLLDPPHPAKKPRATTKIPDGYRGATRERDATTRETNTRRHDTRRHGNIRKVMARKHRDGDGDAIAHRNHRRHARVHAHSHAGGRRLRSSVAAAAAAARRRGDSAAQCETWAAAWCSVLGARDTSHARRGAQKLERGRAYFSVERYKKMHRQEGRDGRDRRSATTGSGAPCAPRATRFHVPGGAISAKGLLCAVGCLGSCKVPAKAPPPSFVCP